MKKKIMALFIIMVMLLSSFVFAADENTNDNGEGAINNITTNGKNIKETAKVLTDSTYLDSKYDAYSVAVNSSKIKIYDYNTTNPKTFTGNETPILYKGNENKYYLTIQTANENPNKKIANYTIKLGADDNLESNVVTFIFEDSLNYNGKLYDVKLNLKEIRKFGNEERVIQVELGSTLETLTNQYDISSYSNAVFPQIKTSENGVLMIRTEYSILDKSGKEYPISGIFMIRDVDMSQGFLVNDYEINSQNTYINADTVETIGYQVMDFSPFGGEFVGKNGSAIYATTDQNCREAESSVYLLMDNRKKIDMALIFNAKAAGSTFTFSKLSNVNKIIETEVKNGTITPTITNIKNGENKKVEYSPKDANKQYLKSITVDGEHVEINDKNRSSYDFNNVTVNHKIVVVYEDKYKVEYDAKGGDPTPNTEYVLPNDKATEPNAQPKKDGYTFKGWYYINEEGKEVIYNFNTPVTKDIKLIAKWETDTVADNKEDSPSKDATTVFSFLPKAGSKVNVITVMFVVLILAAGVFGFKYKKFNKMMK